ncbi:MAG: NUDIX domain-containing protein [Candidatus Magasanikbacteria bacterium]|nr:NUDIX domain-containing protein [Candidatus Magasanikbacteria bacterium]
MTDMTETKRVRCAGGVVVNPDGLVLVVNQGGYSWSLPKGHINDGEETLEAAKREIYEESGVNDLELIADLGSYERYRIALDGGDDLSQFKTIFMFLFKTNQTALAPLDPQNPEARWVPKDEVADLLTHQKDKQFFRSVLSKLTLETR